MSVMQKIEKQRRRRGPLVVPKARRLAAVALALYLGSVAGALALQSIGVGVPGVAWFGVEASRP